MSDEATETMPPADLPGVSDTAAAADRRRGQRRRDSTLAHGDLGRLDAGLFRPCRRALLTDRILLRAGLGEEEEDDCEHHTAQKYECKEHRLLSSVTFCNLTNPGTASSGAQP